MDVYHWVVSPAFVSVARCQSFGRQCHQPVKHYPQPGHGSSATAAATASAPTAAATDRDCPDAASSAGSGTRCHSIFSGAGLCEAAAHVATTADSPKEEPRRVSVFSL